MSRDALRPAREVALNVLDAFDAAGGDVTGILRGNIDRTSDRGLATDLVFGVTRNRTCLDNIIDKVSGVAVERISSELVNILRMGVYEMVYCPGREVYAIVSETMKLTGGMGRQQRGFANAILRKAARLIAGRSASLLAARRTMTVPVGPESGCSFSIELFPDPAKQPADYLCQAFSLPRWLVDGWVEAYGFKDATGACFGSNRRPSVYIRPSTLKCEGVELFERFRQEGIDCEMVIDEGIALQTRGGKAIENLPGFAEGLFSVQDLTASEAVRMLGLKRGSNVLDLCAAPGGKTIQMAQAMGDAENIIATDFDARRLDRVKENVERMGLKSVKVVAYGEVADLATAIGGFDAVLLDVPCSNTGVMARRLEVRLRLTKGAVESVAKVQRGILAGAAGLVKPGGRICYSTCSIEEAENEAAVGWFLEERKDFELVAQKLTLPAASRIDRDGGYAAVLRKREI